MFIHVERLKIPVLIRNVGIEIVWRFYAKDKNGQASELKEVGRTLFYEFVLKLAKGDVKQRAFVDYKLHGLVYDNTDEMKRIIDNHVRDVVKRKELKKKLKSICEFLKYSFIAHLRTSSQDPRHSIKFALGHGSLDESKRMSSCYECNAEFHFFHFVKEFKDAFFGMTLNIEKILKDGSTKSQLFMRHVVRKNVQENAMMKLFQWLRSG